ncbi:MAG: PD-(D/E)XK nuclease family protein [Pirellulaceae bacterium]
MGITREFLDWSQPALPSVVDYLLRRYGRQGQADLGEVDLVFPGARAGRRLLEILVEAAAARRLALVPPRIATVGQLPELLYRPQRPFAGELVQQLAWTHALRRTDRQQLLHVVARPPEEHDQERWMELGDLLRALHRELASDVLDFADVASHAAELEGDDERRRWQVLADVQRRYLATLDELELWDRQTARRVAIENRECRTERDVILVGTVDANVTIRRMLDAVARRVTTLVLAPPERADDFDQHGALRAERWQEREIPLRDEQVTLVDGVAEQADAAVRALADLDGAYAADEITIGVADERLVPHLLRQFEECRLPARWGPGGPISQTPPYRLLAQLGRYVSRGRRYRDFAAAARHPDVTQWLSRQGVAPGWLAELDDFYNRRLPSQIEPSDYDEGDPRRFRQLGAAYAKVEQLLTPLARGPQPLAAWTEHLSELLLQLYGHHPLDREVENERVTLAACEAIHKALLEHVNVPEALMPKVTAEEAIRLTLAAAESGTIASPADEAAVELLGWLELPLDDAPVLIVTGFNEGFVPKAVTSDLFLPNTLRVRLGLEDNARRYARDAYALSALAASRKVLRLVVGRRDAEHNPLAPSRLLFAADAETIAHRALHYFADELPQANSRRVLAGGLSTDRLTPNFPVPRPQPPQSPITRLSPSAVRTYLGCPYRYYLRHVLRLKAIDDLAAELDGGAFGELLHGVLLDFGQSELRDSTDAEAIRRLLHDALDRRTLEQFGGQALTPIEIQIEQMRLRLQRFADVQARHAEDGWVIQRTEIDASAEILVDDQPITVGGRIDRIDRHRETGQTLILDYKSGDSAKSPDEAHRKSGDWIDLQLPLYRHLARDLGVEGPVRLAYFLLPKDVARVGVYESPWSDVELASADERFWQVVRDIRGGLFWPPAEHPPWGGDEFSVICQDNVLDKTPPTEAPPAEEAHTP